MIVTLRSARWVPIDSETQDVQDWQGRSYRIVVNGLLLKNTIWKAIGKETTSKMAPFVRSGPAMFRSSAHKESQCHERRCTSSHRSIRPNRSGFGANALVRARHRGNIRRSHPLPGIRAYSSKVSAKRTPESAGLIIRLGISISCGSRAGVVGLCLFGHPPKADSPEALAIRFAVFRGKICNHMTRRILAAENRLRAASRCRSNRKRERADLLVRSALCRR